ncbi:MAG: C2H2-type zinc finger protein [Thermoplasmata archaeon]
MRHAGKRTGGTVAIGLLVAMLMASVFGASLLALPLAGSSTHVGASHGTEFGAAPHPVSAASSHPSAATASITATNSAAKYQQIPFLLSLQISVTGADIRHNASLWVSITDNVTGAFCGAVSGNQTAKTGTDFYNLSFDAVSLGTAAVACPLISADQVILTPSIAVVNATISDAAVFANATTTPQITAFILGTLSVTLISPTGAVGAGNVSLVAVYTAQYLTSVRILVYSVGKTATLFNGSLQWANAASPAVGTWFVAAAGSYPFTLTVATAYGSYSENGNLTVLNPGGGTVYKNASTWQNSSIFPGVSGAVSGTILLVVGLILGMIVALAVGRSLMRPAAAAPAQAWQPTGAAANQCSVCGKSFATPEELQAHAKSEHGMN